MTESIFDGDNCFQNALNDALDYQRIKKDPQEISKIRSYISQYNWKEKISVKQRRLEKV